MKKVLVVVALLVVLGLVALGIWYALTPHTPEQHHARLRSRLGQVPPGDINGYEQVLAEYERVEQLMEEKFPESNLRDQLAYERIEIVDSHIGDATRALPLYEDFVKRFPDSERLPECYYRIGEILLAQKKYLPAVEAFRDVVTRFPAHSLASDAQYQVGLIFSEIGEHQVALKELRAVVERYPDSPQAPKAQLKIADILSEKMEHRREALQELEKLQVAYASSAEASVAEGVGRALSEEQVQEDEQDYQKERYRYPPPDHTQSWQEEQDEATGKKIAAQGLDIQHYDLEARLLPKEHRVEARVVMTFDTKAAKEINPITLRLGQQMSIRRIALLESPQAAADIPAAVSGENDIVFKHEEGVLACRLPQAVTGGQRLSLYFDYVSESTAPSYWRGDVIGAASGFLRPESRWYPYTVWGDNATCKATYALPEPLQVISNGVVQDERVEAGVRRATWEATLPFFGITLAYGPYTKTSREVKVGRRSFPLSCYTLAEHTGRASEVITEAHVILSFYSERFCPFPYEALKIVEAPAFPGGYGSSTLLLLMSEFFEGEFARWLLAHELSHQWWGNLVGVTLAGEDASIPWLSEGFATYSDILYTEHLESQRHLRQHLDKYASLYYEHSSYGTDEPIRTIRWSSPMYHAVTYEKGALVLHALRYLMGDEAFFRALRAYAERFAFAATTTDDFRRVCEEFYRPEPESPGYSAERERASLEWFFEEWLARPGFPILKIESVKAVPEGAGFKVEVTIIQEEYVYRLPIDVRMSGHLEKTSSQRVWLSMPDEVLSFDSPWVPQEVELDPESWILKDPKPAFIQWKLSG